MILILGLGIYTFRLLSSRYSLSRVHSRLSHDPILRSGALTRQFVKWNTLGFFFFFPFRDHEISRTWYLCMLFRIPLSFFPLLHSWHHTVQSHIPLWSPRIMYPTIILEKAGQAEYEGWWCLVVVSKIFSIEALINSSANIAFLTDTVLIDCCWGFFLVCFFNPCTSLRFNHVKNFLLYIFSFGFCCFEGSIE